MTPWFIRIKGSVPISRKEVPVDIAEVSNLPDLSQPETAWQALMQTMPNQDAELSKDVPNPIRDAIVDCVEMLSEQDRYIINAIIWEQVTLSVLGSRLGCSTPHASRLRDAAYENLKQLLFMHDTLRKYLLNERQ